MGRKCISVTDHVAKDFSQRNLESSYFTQEMKMDFFKPFRQKFAYFEKSVINYVYLFCYISIRNFICTHLFCEKCKSYENVL